MSVSMTSRERLLAAIRHEEPDRVPKAPRIHAYLLEYYGCSCWVQPLKVWEVMEVAIPGGGFTLSTSDSIWDGTPLEHVRAYFEAAREFGN